DPAPHRATGAVPGPAFDEDHAFDHAAPAPREGCTRVVTRRSDDVDHAAFQLGADPVSDVAFNSNRAARHAGAEVSAGPAATHDLAPGHPGTDPVNRVQLPVEIDAPIGGLARDAKELAEWDAVVAVEELDTLDLAEGSVGDAIGCDPFQIDGQG